MTYGDLRPGDLLIPNNEFPGNFWFIIVINVKEVFDRRKMLEIIYLIGDQVFTGWPSTESNINRWFSDVIRA